jgi:WD40 repeat protein
MNSDGTGQTNITNNPALDTAAAWSPNAQKIAFVTTRDGNSEIYTMNPNGSGLANLTQNAATDSGPDWSPDGSKIAFSSRRDGNAEIYVMNANGTGQTRLTTNSANDLSPAWSPDGQEIAFRSNLGSTGYEIWTMDADGTNPQKLTNNTYIDIDPDWQPLSYPHPQSAPRVDVSLVPTFKQCGTGGNPPTAAHAAPLASPSCASATTGAAHLGAQALASASFSAVADNPGTPADETDLALSANATDVRATSVSGPDYNPNGGGPDLTLVARLRMTDARNGPSQTDSATATEIDFSAPVACFPTASTTIGSTCSANTSADALMPGAFTGGGQAVLQLFRVRVDDSGPNNVYEGGAGDDRLLLQQGIFSP